jgi:hypothetical protein
VAFFILKKQTRSHISTTKNESEKKKSEDLGERMEALRGKSAEFLGTEAGTRAFRRVLDLEVFKSLNWKYLGGLSEAAFIETMEEINREYDEEGPAGGVQYSLFVNEHGKVLPVVRIERSGNVFSLWWDKDTPVEQISAGTRIIHVGIFDSVSSPYRTIYRWIKREDRRLERGTLAGHLKRWKPLPNGIMIFWASTFGRQRPKERWEDEDMFVDVAESAGSRPNAALVIARAEHVIPYLVSVKPSLSGGFEGFPAFTFEIFDHPTFDGTIEFEVDEHMTPGAFISMNDPSSHIPYNFVMLGMDGEGITDHPFDRSSIRDVFMVQKESLQKRAKGVAMEPVARKRFGPLSVSPDVGPPNGKGRAGNNGHHDDAALLGRIAGDLQMKLTRRFPERPDAVADAVDEVERAFSDALKKGTQSQMMGKRAIGIEVEEATMEFSRFGQILSDAAKKVRMLTDSETATRDEKEVFYTADGFLRDLGDGLDDEAYESLRESLSRPPRDPEEEEGMFGDEEILF